MTDNTLKHSTNTAYVIFLAVVAAVGGILFGYDTAVISGTTEIVRNQFHLTDVSEGWYVGCAIIGSIAGVLAAGTMSDYLGRKLTMLISAVFFTVSAIGCTFCGSFDSLVVYRIIGGVGIGIVSIVSPIYISEIAPAKIRGSLVSLYQLAVTIGFLLAYLANWLISNNINPEIIDAASSGMEISVIDKVMHTEAWRGMLGSETFVALLFCLIIFTIPESPRWLQLKKRDTKALAVLKRIYTSENDARVHMAEASKSIQDDSKSSWSALLKPGMILAVLIGSAIAILGQFMGVNAVLYYGPKIFLKAGFEDPMFSTVLVGLVNFITTILAVFIIDRVGRKQLIYWGVSGMIISLLCIAAYFSFGAELNLGNGFMLTFFLLYVFCCAISICAVVFVLLSEMYPNSVRGRAMSIAGFALWIGTYIVGQITPALLGWSEAGTFLIFAAMCVPYILLMWKAVPETTGKSLEEIEKYWEK